MSVGTELGQQAYILQTKLKNMRFNGGVWTPPLGTPVSLPKDTARVDSRLKLTFGQLVNN